MCLRPGLSAYSNLPSLLGELTSYITNSDPIAGFRGWDKMGWKGRRGRGKCRMEIGGVCIISFMGIDAPGYRPLNTVKLQK